ncbi:MAG: MFS transporter [Acidobacteriota bacterium]
MSAYAAFSSRNYRYLLAAASSSMLGQQMLSVVVAWDLYRITRSALALGNVGLAQVLPVFLFTFIAGNIADRKDRSRTGLITQTSAGLVGVLLFVAGEHRSVWMIYACLFLIATARAFQWPVTSSMLPQTVPLQHLTNAVSWNGSARETATMVGPALGGFIISQWGSEPVYLGQAICSLISAYCYHNVHVPALTKVNHDQPGWKATLEGLKFVWREKVILSSMSLDLLAVLFGGATALMPIFALDILHVGAKGLGWLQAAPAMGAGLMSLALAHRSTIGAAGKALLWAVIGFGVATVVFALSTNFWLSLAALFLLGAFDAISVVLRISLVQMRTPDYLRGRVAAVNALFISSSNQWGAVESGVAASLLGTVPSVVFGGMMTIVIVALIGWRATSLREWRN